MWGKHCVLFLGAGEVFPKIVWIERVKQFQRTGKRVSRWVCGDQTVIVRMELCSQYMG